MFNYYKLAGLLAVCAINCLLSAHEPTRDSSQVSGPRVPGRISRESNVDQVRPEVENRISRRNQQWYRERLQAERTARYRAHNEAMDLREQLRSMRQWIWIQQQIGAMQAWNQICSMNRFPPFTPHETSGASSSYDMPFTSPAAGFQQFTSLPSATPFLFHSVSGSQFPIFPNTPLPEWPAQGWTPGEWPAYPHIEEEGQGSTTEDEGQRSETAPSEEVETPRQSPVLQWLDSASIRSDNSPDVDAPTSNSFYGNAASSSREPAQGLRSFEEGGKSEASHSIELARKETLNVYFFEKPRSKMPMRIKDSCQKRVGFLELPILKNTAGDRYCSGFFCPKKYKKMVQLCLKTGLSPLVRRYDNHKWLNVTLRVDGVEADVMPKLRSGQRIEVIFLGKDRSTESR